MQVCCKDYRSQCCLFPVSRRHKLSYSCWTAGSSWHSLLLKWTEMTGLLLHCGSPAFHSPAVSGLPLLVLRLKKHKLLRDSLINLPYMNETKGAVRECGFATVRSGSLSPMNLRTDEGRDRDQLPSSPQAPLKASR